MQKIAANYVHELKIDEDYKIEDGRARLTQEGRRKAERDFNKRKLNIGDREFEQYREFGVDEWTQTVVWALTAREYAAGREYTLNNRVGRVFKVKNKEGIEQATIIIESLASQTDKEGNIIATVEVGEITFAVELKGVIYNNLRTGEELKKAIESVHPEFKDLEIDNGLDRKYVDIIDKATGQVSVSSKWTGLHTAIEVYLESVGKANFNGMYTEDMKISSKYSIINWLETLAGVSGYTGTMPEQFFNRTLSRMFKKGIKRVESEMVAKPMIARAKVYDTNAKRMSAIIDDMFKIRGELEDENEKMGQKLNTNGLLIFGSIEELRIAEEYIRTHARRLKKENGQEMMQDDRIITIDGERDTHEEIANKIKMVKDAYENGRRGYVILATNIVSIGVDVPISYVLNAMAEQQDEAARKQLRDRAGRNGNQGFSREYYSIEGIKETDGNRLLLNKLKNSYSRSQKDAILDRGNLDTGGEEYVSVFNRLSATESLDGEYLSDTGIEVMKGITAIETESEIENAERMIRENEREVEILQQFATEARKFAKGSVIWQKEYFGKILDEDDYLNIGKAILGENVSQEAARQVGRDHIEKVRDGVYKRIIEAKDLYLSAQEEINAQIEARFADSRTSFLLSMVEVTAGTEKVIARDRLFYGAASKVAIDGIKELMIQVELEVTVEAQTKNIYESKAVNELISRVDKASKRNAILRILNAIASFFMSILHRIIPVIVPLVVGGGLILIALSMLLTPGAGVLATIGGFLAKIAISIAGFSGLLAGVPFTWVIVIAVVLVGLMVVLNGFVKRVTSAVDERDNENIAEYRATGRGFIAAGSGTINKLLSTLSKIGLYMSFLAIASGLLIPGLGMAFIATGILLGVIGVGSSLLLMIKNRKVLINKKVVVDTPMDKTGRNIGIGLMMGVGAVIPVILMGWISGIFVGIGFILLMLGLKYISDRITGNAVNIRTSLLAKETLIPVVCALIGGSLAALIATGMLTITGSIVGVLSGGLMLAFAVLTTIGVITYIVNKNRKDRIAIREYVSATNKIDFFNRPVFKTLKNVMIGIIWTAIPLLFSGLMLFIGGFFSLSLVPMLIALSVGIVVVVLVVFVAGKERTKQLATATVSATGVALSVLSRVNGVSQTKLETQSQEKQFSEEQSRNVRSQVESQVSEQPVSSSPALETMPLSSPIAVAMKAVGVSCVSSVNPFTVPLSMAPIMFTQFQETSISATDVMSEQQVLEDAGYMIENAGTDSNGRYYVIIKNGVKMKIYATDKKGNNVFNIEKINELYELKTFNETMSRAEDKYDANGRLYWSISVGKMEYTVYPYDINGNLISREVMLMLFNPLLEVLKKSNPMTANLVNMLDDNGYVYWQVGEYRIYPFKKDGTLMTTEELAKAITNTPIIEAFRKYLNENNIVLEDTVIENILFDREGNLRGVVKWEGGEITNVNELYRNYQVYKAFKEYLTSQGVMLEERVIGEILFDREGNLRGVVKWEGGEIKNVNELYRNYQVYKAFKGYLTSQEVVLEERVIGEILFDSRGKLREVVKWEDGRITNVDELYRNYQVYKAFKEYLTSQGVELEERVIGEILFDSGGKLREAVKWDGGRITNAEELFKNYQVFNSFKESVYVKNNDGTYKYTDEEIGLMLFNSNGELYKWVRLDGVNVANIEFLISNYESLKSLKGENNWQNQCDLDGNLYWEIKIGENSYRIYPFDKNGKVKDKQNFEKELNNINLIENAFQELTRNGYYVEIKYDENNNLYFKVSLHSISTNKSLNIYLFDDRGNFTYSLGNVRDLFNAQIDAGYQIFWLTVLIAPIVFVINLIKKWWKSSRIKKKVNFNNIDEVQNEILLGANYAPDALGDCSKKLRLFRLLNPQIAISKDTLMLLGFDEALSVLVANNMNATDAVTTQASAPNFPAAFDANFMRDLFLCNYSDAIIVRELLTYLADDSDGQRAILDEIFNRIENIVDDNEKNNNAYMWDAVKKSLMNRIEEVIFQRIIAGHDLDDVLNNAPPMDSILVLRKMKQLGLINNESIRAIIVAEGRNRPGTYSEMFDEIVYRQVVLAEYNRISQFLPDSWGETYEYSTNEDVRERMLKRLSIDIRSSLVLDPSKLKTISIPTDIKFEIDVTQPKGPISTTPLTLREAIIYNLLQMNPSSTIDYGVSNIREEFNRGDFARAIRLLNENNIKELNPEIVSNLRRALLDRDVKTANDCLVALEALCYSLGAQAIDWPMTTYLTVMINKAIEEYNERINQINTATARLDTLNIELNMRQNLSIPEQIITECCLVSIREQIDTLNRNATQLRGRRDVEERRRLIVVEKKIERLSILMELAVRQQQVSNVRTSVIEHIESMHKVLLLKAATLAENMTDITQNQFERNETDMLGKRMTDEKWRYLFALLLSDFNGRSVIQVEGDRHGQLETEEEYAARIKTRKYVNIDLYNLSVEDLEIYFQQVAKAMGITFDASGRSIILPSYMANQNIVNPVTKKVNLIKAIAFYYDRISTQRAKIKDKDLQNQYDRDHILKFSEALNNDYLTLSNKVQNPQDDKMYNEEVKSVQELMNELSMVTGNKILRTIRGVFSSFFIKFFGFEFWGINTTKQKIKTIVLIIGLVLLASGFFTMYFFIPMGTVAGVLGVVLEVLKQLAFTFGGAFLSAATIIPKMIFGYAENDDMKSSYLKLASVFSVLWGGILGGLFTRGFPVAIGYILLGGSAAFLAIVTLLVGLVVWLFTGSSTFMALSDFMLGGRGQAARNQENKSLVYQANSSKIKTQIYSVAVMIFAVISAWVFSGGGALILGLSLGSIILIIGSIVAAIFLLISYVRNWSANGFFKSDLVLLISGLAVFAVVPLVTIIILPALAGLSVGTIVGIVIMAFLALAFIIYGLYSLYNHLKTTDKIEETRYQKSYKQFLERERYGLLIEGSTVQGYFKRTLIEMKEAGLISDYEFMMWTNALNNPDNIQNFVVFKDSRAKSIMDSIFETISLERPLIGSKYAMPSSAIVLQTGQEVTGVSIDQLLLPDTGDKKGTLLGKYAKKQATSWQEVLRRIENLSIKEFMSYLYFLRQRRVNADDILNYVCDGLDEEVVNNILNRNINFDDIGNVPNTMVGYVVAIFAFKDIPEDDNIEQALQDRKIPEEYKNIYRVACNEYRRLRANDVDIVLVEDNAYFNDMMQIHNFVEKLKNLKEEDAIDIPLVHTDRARVLLAEIANYLEDFGNQSIFSNTPVYKSIASDMFQMHRKLAIDNSDLEYLRSLELVFANPEYKGSLEEAYAKEVEKRHDSPFVNKYEAYKVKVRTLLLPTISNYFVRSDLELKTDDEHRLVTRSDSLEKFLKELESGKYGANGQYLSQSLRDRFYQENAGEEVPEEQRILNLRIQVQTRYNDISLLLNSIKGDGGIITMQAIFNKDRILQAIQNSAMEDGAKARDRDAIEIFWGNYEEASRDFVEAFQRFRDMGNDDIDRFIASTLEPIRERLKNALTGIENIMRVYADNFNAGTYVKYEVLPKMAQLLNILNTPLTNLVPEMEVDPLIAVEALVPQYLIQRARDIADILEIAVRHDADNITLLDTIVAGIRARLAIEEGQDGYIDDEGQRASLNIFIEEVIDIKIELEDYSRKDVMPIIVKDGKVFYDIVGEAFLEASSGLYAAKRFLRHLAMKGVLNKLRDIGIDIQDGLWKSLSDEQLGSIIGDETRDPKQELDIGTMMALLEGLGIPRFLIKVVDHGDGENIRVEEIREMTEKLKHIISPQGPPEHMDFNEYKRLLGFTIDDIIGILNSSPFGGLDLKNIFEEA
ncbi:MAG: hypothetical protein LBM02_03000, partial [Lachnospiraceae bacterium]|nr:hypothetical protein [Lachnospiraceae bacterium]